MIKKQLPVCRDEVVYCSIKIAGISLKMVYSQRGIFSFK
jgi:hypothetical protein